MKKSELGQIIREEISKILKEDKLVNEIRVSIPNSVKLKFDLIAYPRKHHDPNQPDEIIIPAGKSIGVIEHPFKNLPNTSLIKYKDQEWVVVRSSLDNAIKLNKYT